MRAWLLTSYGKPSVLTLKQVPDPQPGKNEVLVRMKYVGINFAEILSRKGLYGWAPKKPYILGMEGSGIIENVGEKVDQSRIGEPVMVAAQYGCYAEKTVIPQEQAIPIIDGYSMQESAAFLVNYMTAWVALSELAKVTKNEKVLISPAAGGVGTAAVQIAIKLGCDVFGLAGCYDKIEFIKTLGAKAGFNYREKNCFEQLKNASGGVDVVIEMVGGKVYKESFNLLNALGRIVVVGFASLDINWWNPLSWYRTIRDIPRMKIMDLAVKSGGVMASHLGYLLKNPERMQVISGRLRTFISCNEIKPVVGKIFPFDKAADAHEFIESRESVGKVLLEL